MARFGVDWTPTILILDPDGQERHRIEGFLPQDDFLSQVMLGRAHLAFKNGRHEEAESRYREIVARLPDTDAAAEALYWAGVSRYKAKGDAVALKETAEAFKTQYAGSTWATKASIWS